MLQDTTTSSDTIFLACSVHGLRDSRSEEEWKKRGLEGEGAGSGPPGTGAAPAKESRRNWLSSLNTVVGERQENIVLVLCIYANEDPDQRMATPAAASTPRRSTPLSAGGASSSSIRPLTNTPTLLYQSEQRSVGQRSGASLVGGGWPPASGFASSGGTLEEGRADGLEGKHYLLTPADEGIVHFSLPAQVSRGSAGDAAEPGFTVTLWQVVNRTRRALLGSDSSLSGQDLWNLPNDPRKFGVFRNFHSERYPSAFLVIRRLGPSVPRPLSLSPAGVANPVAGQFNPMTTYFTTLRRAAAVQDVKHINNSAASFGEHTMASSRGNEEAGGLDVDKRGGDGDGDGDGYRDAVAAAARWELVVCQELAVESKFAFKVPLQFLFPVHNAMKQAALAWRRRAREERIRQGLFDTDEEAFANGRVLVRVSVSRARGLDILAEAAAEASTGGGSGAFASPPDEEDDRQRSDPFDLTPALTPGMERLSSTGFPSDVGGVGDETDTGDRNGGTTMFGRGGRGIGRGGIGLGLAGIDGKKVSTSMRRLGGRVRGMGAKAVTMAKNASQASPSAHLRLGAGSVREKLLRQANFFVKVVYEPPPPSAPSSLSSSEEAFWWAGDGGIDCSAVPPPSPVLGKVVGVTNTEYGSVEPVWGTNSNRHACPYNQPRLQHQVYGTTRLEVVGSPDVPDDGSESWEYQETAPRGPLPDALAFDFYVSSKDLDNKASSGGSLRLHLCQNKFSWKDGIEDVPVGVVTIPLSASANASSDARDSVRRPRWRDMESYDGVEGGLEQMGSPQILVGVSIQTRGTTTSRPGSPRRQSLPVNASSITGGVGGGDQLLDGGVLGLGQGALGRIGVAAALRFRGIGSSGSLAAKPAGTEGAESDSKARRGSGEWTKVDEEESDSDEEDLKAAKATAKATTSRPENMETPLDPAEEGVSILPEEKTVGLGDCYRWMDAIGGPSLVLDTQALIELSSLVEYPLDWIEAHWRGVANQRDKLARGLDLYSHCLAEGTNFRSSLLKKDPLHQYIATNLHIQVWSINNPATGKTRSHDIITTGAPAAHAIGYAGGGLVTLQAALQSLGTKVLSLKAACRECAQRGESHRIMEQEANIARLRHALLEYESLSGAVAMRRACIVSQAVTIAATSFCTKLEMMARGTLEIGRDMASGGCASFDDLARRWITSGFLLGFEGLLSIHGKEHGMVEDTVCALDMLADFQLQVVPSNPENPLSGLRDLPRFHVGDDAATGDEWEFELDVGVEERTIKCIGGSASLARLPRVLWDRSSVGEWGRTGAGGRGGSIVRIVPVMFTQGIDIQQSMSHASSTSKEKAAFQANINSANLARLNRYCHRVCPVSHHAHKRAATPGPMFATPADKIEREEAGEDLPDLLDFGGGMSGPGLGEEKAVKPPLDSAAAAGVSPKLSHYISSGASVPDWIHPALSELETAVRDDKVNHKNTAILLEAQLAIRRLCGGRVTFCKSGKDRTAMSITLEEALLLVENASSQGKSSRDAGDTTSAAAAAGCGWRAADRNGALADANVLRAHGCRLMVAEKNIGYPLYSFNALQRQFIPELYQPPPQTIQDVITSALNRDS